MNYLEVGSLLNKAVILFCGMASVGLHMKGYGLFGVALPVAFAWLVAIGHLEEVSE